MINIHSLFIPFTFVLLVLYVLVILYLVLKIGDKSLQVNADFLFVCLLGNLILQCFLSYQGVYSDSLTAMPPQIFLFGIFPSLFIIVYLFVSSKGRSILDAISIKKCTYIHIVRVPVEIVLYFLLLEKTIPKLMTFEGVNFDIFIGLSAPFIIYYGYIKKRLSKKVILIWNFIGLIMVLNVFVIGILSAPFPLQQLAFNQSNIAMLHFPYSLLPIFIVPAVILAHLVSIRQLFFNKMII